VALVDGVVGDFTVEQSSVVGVAEAVPGTTETARSYCRPKVCDELRHL